MSAVAWVAIPIVACLAIIWASDRLDEYLESRSTHVHHL